MSSSETVGRIHRNTGPKIRKKRCSAKPGQAEPGRAEPGRAELSRAEPSPAQPISKSNENTMFFNTFCRKALKTQCFSILSAEKL